MRKSLVWVALFAAGAVGGPVLAEGGGGGSGPSAPSMSAPQFDPAAEYLKGVDALKAGKFKNAERAFAKVAQAAPRDANTQVLLGLARGGQNNWKGAQRAYEKALKASPDLIPARRELAVSLARQGQAELARAELDRLKGRDATCANACPEAADLKAAVAAVETALAPVAPAAANDRASLLFVDAGAGDRAYLQAVGLINEKRYDAALASLGKAGEAFGPHPDVLTYLGYTHRKLGRFDKAEAYYRQALNAAPDHRGALEYYGELKVEQGDAAGALQLLARLEDACAFGCAEAETLRLWIDQGPQP